MEQTFNRKVIAITGASSGIGEATALLLARRGASVVLGARRPARLHDLAARIVAAGGKAAFAVTDVTRRADLEALVALACSEFGTLDAIINNAGISQLSRLDALDVEGWEEMIDINLKGTLYGMAAAMPVFLRQGSGHIVNIISTAGIRIVPMMGVYAATKNAVRTITEAFRQESDGRVRITGISPGFVQTEFAGHIKNTAMRSAISERMESLAITPDAIAATVAFALEQPPQVEIGDLVIRPAAQD